MAHFSYRARDKMGALVTGEMDATDMRELEGALDRMGLIPVKVRTPATRISLSWLKDAFSRVSDDEVIHFSRQLATLFGAGVPLTKALQTLERQTLNPVFAKVVLSVREDIEGGATFFNAVKKHPRVFSELYANMIEAGEAGGILDSVLDRLAFMLEKSAENRAKVKSATLYPKIVLGALAIAVVILMNFVVPRFASLYSSFRIELPLPTRMLIKVSGAFVSYWYLMFIAAAVAYAMARLYVSTERGRLRLDGFSLKVPIFGPIIHKSILSRFSRVLGALYRSGLPILQSLDIASRAVENRLIAANIKSIEEDVRAGKSLSEPMGKTGVFTPLVVQMVAVGEETGNLDEMLEKVAMYYDQEVDTSIKNLTTTLEPVLLGFIFVFVLFLALSIFLPMWDIIKVVKR